MTKYRRSKKLVFAFLLFSIMLCISPLTASANTLQQTPEPPGKESIFPLESYEDLDQNAWYYEALDFCWNRAIAAEPEETFIYGPNKPMTRGATVVALATLAHSNGKTNLWEYTSHSFIDVDLDEYYDKHIAWAEANGIVKGYGNGYLGPNDPISREQAAVMLKNFMDYMKLSAEGKKEFADMHTVSSWAKESVAALGGSSVIADFPDGNFYPRRQLTKAEGAVLLHRFCQSFGMMS